MISISLVGRYAVFADDPSKAAYIEKAGNGKWCARSIYTGKMVLGPRKYLRGLIADVHRNGGEVKCDWVGCCDHCYTFCSKPKALVCCPNCGAPSK